MAVTNSFRLNKSGQERYKNVLAKGIFCSVMNNIAVAGAGVQGAVSF
jgi:hypothetical protein